MKLFEELKKGEDLTTVEEPEVEIFKPKPYGWKPEPVDIKGDAAEEI